jgi:hypothetical protein
MRPGVINSAGTDGYLTANGYPSPMSLNEGCNATAQSVPEAKFSIKYMLLGKSAGVRLPLA